MMGNKYYKRSADLERVIVREWLAALKKHGVAGDGTRSAGSRHRFDCKLNFRIHERMYVIGVQVKYAETKPTKKFCRDIRVKGWVEDGLIGIVAWKIPRKKTLWFPISPESILLGYLNRHVEMQEVIYET